MPKKGVKRKPQKRRTRRKTSKRTSFIKNLDFGKIFLSLFFAFLFITGYFVYDLPDIDNVKPIDSRPSIKILANDGSEIARYGGKKRKIVGLDEIPNHLVDAVVAVEDGRFYDHFGIDPIGIARAFATNIKKGSFAQGGSTITQQLTKNIFLTPKKTIKRKVQEALMAIQIEQKYSKDEILTAYLNRVYLGSGAYGVEAAARTYFSKSVKYLTLWESAIIAGLLKAPSRYSPNNNPKLAHKRAKAVLGRMKAVGYLDEDLDISKLQKPKTYKTNKGKKDIENYFADWVINRIDSFINTTGGDITVHTTIDPRMQAEAEKQVTSLHKQIKDKNKVEQIALITQAKDGAVLAMIGGVNYKKSQFNRTTQALRQTGSVFKPLVYLSAIEQGFTPDNYIEDQPTEYDEYTPKNYADKYYGQVTLTEALQKSLNSATVYLLKKTGLRSLNSVAERAAIDVELNQDLSAALGSTEIPLITMNNAYTVFANGGKAVWPYAVLSIEDNKGEVIYQKPQIELEQSFAEKDIKQLNSILEEVMSEEGTGKAAKFSNYTYMAGKTGTSQNYRDAWFIGFTDKYVTGIWMGNDNNSPMVRVTGGNYPALLWKNYMRNIYHLDIDDMFKPEGNNNFFDMIGRWSFNN